MNNMNDNTEIEIDLREVFFAVRKWLWLIALVSFLGGVAAFGYTKFLVTPIYTAQNSMLVLTKETTLASLADLQMGTQLTNDYKVLATSRPVLEQVISNLNLNMSYQGLKSSITIKNPEDTRILEIYVQNPDPQLALRIVREVATTSSEFIGDMMEVIPPKIIDKGVLPTKKTSPSNLKNTVLGILLGAVLSGGVVVLRTILDDTIKSEEDIDKFLGLSTLGSIPDRKDYINLEKDKASGKSFKKQSKKDKE